MKLRSLPLQTAALLFSAFVAAHAAYPQSAAIALDPTTLRPAVTSPVKGEAPFANPPANFYAFASAHVGQPSSVEGLKLKFAAPTTLTGIRSTKDFTVEPGGTCAEGKSFAKGDTCILLVRFTPQGPGPRSGHVTIAHSASATPFSLGLGGNGYAPVISFTPALITTVPGTYPSSKGLLKSAQNLIADGSDSLYIADTGNGIIRYIDSSGTIASIASGYTGATGVAVDTFGEGYFDIPSTNLMYEIFDYGPVVPLSGSGTTGCTPSAPCILDTEALDTPREMSIDRYNNMFFVDGHNGAALSTVQPEPANLIFLYDPFPYQTTPSSAMAADANDNLYSLWSTSGDCEIVQSSLYDAENDNVRFNKVVGGRTCGFSGDGGQAGNAEIRGTIGQITFDIAGNLYFTDTANQRVRRVLATTGIINTIAGNGTAGYTGDGASATSATLSSPTGVTVDSQGQVYIISTAAPTGTAQVIRKLGPGGYTAFGNQTVGTTSTAHVMTITNVGNETLTVNNILFEGAAPGDYSIDPDTTSCPITAGSTLASGQVCKLGILFKPSASGARNATLTFLDNTVTNTNTVQVTGTGVTAGVKLSPPKIAFPSTEPKHTSSLPVSITNNGNADLNIASIAAAGTNAKMFSYTSSNCGASIAPGRTCTLQVTFKPDSVGSYSATFKIADNALDSPQTISVSGTGTASSGTTLEAH